MESLLVSVSSVLLRVKKRFMGMLVSIEYQIGGAILAMQKLILVSLFCLSFVCAADDDNARHPGSGTNGKCWCSLLR